MSKKIKKIIAKDGYDWKYTVIGGVTRVSVESGEDIAHLPELDQKMWTVLSCPVKGLEFDEKTLQLMDSDKDGRIRVSEVMSATVWLKKVLKDMDYLLQGKDKISFAELQGETDEGRQVLDSARLILGHLGLSQEEISMADVAKYLDVYEENCKAEYEAENKEPYTAPYGDNSDDAEAAVAAIRSKIGDYFMRCKLVQFDSDASAALDVQVEKIAAISGNNLADSAAEISAYPLARPRADALLPLATGINPAWQTAFDTLKKLVIDIEYPGKETITEEEWNGVLAKVDAYTAWKAAGKSAMEEAVAEKVKAHAAAIEPVEKLLRLCRDFYRLLQNFVVLKDFYSRQNDTQAVFQAGRLFIDQRCCELCIKVSDMGKQTAQAGLSGICLLYCHCVSKVQGKEMDIVAALTDGDVDGLREGKNAIFYDRNGQDWDATVTKIIDNPISIRQAFWSPYRKFGKWVTDKITKSAEEKESKQFDEMTSKADAGTAGFQEKLAAQQAAKADGTTPPPPAEEKKPAMAFDIAKFAGIFAAIGLAVGAIGGALAALGGFIAAKWYNVILLVGFVVVVISGPSMLLAWLKLRKRNLGPVLNANGWAINSKIKINTAFGATLTSVAKYPTIVMNDPFADKKMAWWKKCLIWLGIIVVVAFAALYLTHNLPWQKTEPQPATTTEVVAPAEPAEVAPVSEEL